MGIVVLTLTHRHRIKRYTEGRMEDAAPLRGRRSQSPKKKSPPRRRGYGYARAVNEHADDDDDDDSGKPWTVGTRYSNSKCVPTIDEDEDDEGASTFVVSRVSR